MGNRLGITKHRARIKIKKMMWAISYLRRVKILWTYCKILLTAHWWSTGWWYNKIKCDSSQDFKCKIWQEFDWFVHKNFSLDWPDNPNFPLEKHKLYFRQLCFKCGYKSYDYLWLRKIIINVMPNAQYSKFGLKSCHS